MTSKAIFKMARPFSLPPTLHRYAVGGLLLLGLGSGVAVAAETEDRRLRTIEEVTVTARRVEESLQDTPISVSAFSSRELTQIGVSEAGDIAHYTPNLAMRKQSGSLDDFAVGIRGVANGEPSLAIDPTVGMYVDGIYLARSTGLAFDIVDLQRIEVLRGPQGALFGRNTIGGAINIVTEKPADAFAFKQQVTLGDEDHQRYHTTIDTGRHAGVAAKISALYTQRDGEVTSRNTGATQGRQESQGLRLALNWQPVDTLSVDYTFDLFERESNATINQLSHVRPTVSDPSSPFYGGPYFEQAEAASSKDRVSRLPVRNSDDGNNLSEIEGHALTLAWDVSANLTMKSITSYRDWDKRQYAPMDYASFPADGATLIDAGTGLPVPAGTLVAIFDTRRDSDQHQWTQELQLIGSALDDRLTYTTGLYYFEEKGDEHNPQSLVIPTCLALGEPGCAARGTSLALELPFFAYSTDNLSWALYGELTYELAPRLEATLGYRYTEDEKQTELTNTLDNMLQTVADEDSWTDFSPSLTVNYRVSDQLSTYFKVSTGYRSGGYNVRATRVQDFVTPFDQEEILSYEIGWKSDLLNDTLRFNGAVFSMEYTDQQIAQFSAGTGGGASIITNAGESTTSGMELELVWLPTAGLKIMANYGYINQKYDEFETGIVDPVSGFPTGVNGDIADSASEIRYSPEHSGSLALEYQFAPWRYGQLTLRADATYTGEISFHPQYDLYDVSDEYTLLNARAALATIPVGGNGNLEVALWGRNLADEEYREFGIDFGSLGYAINSYGPLRSIGIDFVYTLNR